MLIEIQGIFSVLMYMYIHTFVLHTKFLEVFHTVVQLFDFVFEF